MSNLSNVLRDQGKFDEAETFARKAVGILDTRYGPEHRESALMRARLGSCLIELGRFEEAEQCLLAAHRVLGPRLAVHDGWSIITVNYLVRLYQRWDKPEQAKTFSGLLPTTNPATTQAS
jgi:tetratricopeptide (TPR) repeat protein